MDPEHVFTKEELVNYLTDFTDSLNDDVKAEIDAQKLASLENVSDGIAQLFTRLDQQKQTIADDEKVIEDYKAKIANYAALQADRMRSEIDNEDDADSDPVQDALDQVKEDD